MKLPDQHYIITDFTQPRESQLQGHEGELVITFHFRGLKDNQQYKTHIATNMHNKNHWADVLRQRRKFLRVRFEPGTLKTTIKGVGIINADSVPHIVDTNANLNDVFGD